MIHRARSIRSALLIACLVSPTVAAQSSDFTFTGGSASGDTESTVTVAFTFDHEGPDVVGWAYGVCSDPAAVVPISIDPADTQTVNGGAPPALVSEELSPEGWGQYVVIDFAINTLPATQGFVLANVAYEIDAGAASGVASLEFCDTIGPAPFITSVGIVGGGSVTPTTVHGSIAISDEEPLFIRGDANDDGLLDIADPIRLLFQFLITGAPLSNCFLADDANGDGLMDIADPIYVLQHLFDGGPPPPAPYPDCGFVAGTAPPDCLVSSCP